MSLRRLIIPVALVLIGALNISAQTASPSPSPSPLSPEQKAERERRLVERRQEIRQREAANSARREIEREKRREEMRARRAKEATERQSKMANRAAERQQQVERREKEREATAAKRATRAAAANRRAALNDGTFRFVSSRINGHFTKVVKGAPYSAVAVTEFVQKFVDGNQIVRRNEAAFYRDNEGRMRVEQKLNTIGKWSAAGDAPRIIMIGDPVSAEYYDLDPRTRTAVKNVRLGKRLQDLNQKAQSSAVPSTKGDAEQKPDFKNISSDGRKRTENLGSKKIEGVEAQGKRTVTTIPAGEIGNTLPIEISDESWYSPELQTVIATKHHDPRSGDTTYQLTNINRREPDRSLFQVPADYKIVNPAPEPAKPKPPAPVTPKTTAPAPVSPKPIAPKVVTTKTTKPQAEKSALSKSQIF